MCLAKMLSSADEAFRYIRTANLSNEMSKEATIDFVTALRRKTRMIFTKIVSYANRIRPGVKRVDIEEKSAIAKSMITQFGIPSQKIMTREITYRMHRVAELAI